MDTINWVLTLASTAAFLAMANASENKDSKALGDHETKLADGTCKEKQTCSKVYDIAELKKRLSPIEFHVTQEKGTEQAFSGTFWKHKQKGTYFCVVCNHPLFFSTHKFISGCGWPAFNDVIETGSVVLTKDLSFDMERTEVTCSHCGAHLGHLFDDGPPPSFRRYCINSASLSFVPDTLAKDTTGSGVDNAKSDL